MSRIATTMTAAVAVLAVAQLLAAAAPEEKAVDAGAAPGELKPTVAAVAPRLVGAWPSIDALLDDFIKAVSEKDKVALLQMRVSQDEYLSIIVPGTVPPGQPPRRNTEKVKQFFWQMLDGKSRYYQDVLLERFAGRHYKRLKLELTEGTQHFAWYDAHGEVRLALQDEREQRWDLETGFIVEVAGEFKFLGYSYD